MTLSAVSLPYYRYIMPYGLAKFVRFAKNVWDIETSDKTDQEIALAGLEAMEQWMNELGLVMNITDLGANKDMLDDLVNGTLINAGGYRRLSKDEVKNIFLECF